MFRDLDCKTTFTSRRRRVGAFTLPEVLVAAGVGGLALLAVASAAFYTSRSFVAIANYVDLDQRSQLALDKMSREIRQARRLTQFSPTALTIEDVNGDEVRFEYDEDARALVRASGGVTTTYLTDCDRLEFSKYQRNTISNTFDAFDPAYVTNTRLIQVSWVCSQKILGTKANSESVQSAKIVMRNN